MPKVSLILPCLNEALTIGDCIQRAKEAFQANKIEGEIIVVDGCSTDGSDKIAEKLGARVIRDKHRGYGLAHKIGVEAAKGQWIVKADSDGTYDLADLPKFVEALASGYEYVVGNRFKGGIALGAMPFLHQFIGNPLLTFMQNTMFKTSLGDAHCGFRAFTRKAFNRMNLKARGWEFATEMGIKAAKLGLKTCEIPVHYLPRKVPSKLSTFGAGWRNIRFLLLFSPDYLFVLPGTLLAVAGLVFVAFGVNSLGLSVFWSADPLFQVLQLMFGGFLFLLGFQIISFGISAKSYAVVEGYEQKDALYAFVNKFFNLEKTAFLGFLLLLVSLSFGFWKLVDWLQYGIISVNELKSAVVLSIAAILGVQVVFNAFFLSIVGIKK
ncbi:MAG: glycosyltransferase family 2 protein [Candidatus Diapherotrites archaeon]|uniref:Glycosyltransferase family 2 protein n=1 Tax=Candidatus Iainarchaeum sp. TaxID=3101447 RepID=A0A8T4L8T1_9ARCH|nr:glycosyltransferase family 2 protein [Candidatus Diapherotrites archaeon]